MAGHYNELSLVLSSFVRIYLSREIPAPWKTHMYADSGTEPVQTADIRGLRHTKFARAAESTSGMESRTVGRTRSLSGQFPKEH